MVLALARLPPDLEVVCKKMLSSSTIPTYNAVQE